MFKKLYLSAAFTTLSFALSTQTTDRVATIQNSIAHIAQETKAVMKELKIALVLADRAETHFKETLKDSYFPVREKCIALLNTIAASPEFISTIEQVTDAQAAFIVETNMQYEQFEVDPSAFPLQQKVDVELALASFDKPTEQAFNVFYVVLAVMTGSKTLIQKLELRKNELEAELSTLQAQTNQ